MLKNANTIVSRYINPQSIAIVIGITLVIIYLPFFLKTPLTSASDVLHHTWIANYISENGTIPTNNPITGNFDILSLSPLFQILGAQLNQLTGMDTIEIMIGLNMALPLLYILGIFVVSKSLFNSRVAVVASLFFLFFNSITYLSRHVTFLEIKQATLAIFLMLICFYLVLLFFKDKKINVRQIIPLFILLLAIQLTHQFTSFAVFAVLGTLALLLIIYYPVLRKKTLVFILILILSFLTVLLLNVNLLFADSTGYLSGSENTLTKEYSQSSTTTSTQTNILPQVFADAYHPVIAVLSIVGMLFIVLRRRKKDPSLTVPEIFIFVWLGTFLILSLQQLGDFQLLPSRFLYWSTIPVTILSAYAFYKVVRLIPPWHKSLSIIVAMLVILILSTVVTNSNSYYSNENISFNEIKSFQSIKEFLHENSNENEKVLADPFLGYKLITLADAPLSYSYSRTGMRRDDSLALDSVEHLFFSDDKAAYEYFTKNNIRYIFINYDDKTRYYQDADYSKFLDTQKYLPVYSEHTGTEDEIIGYEVVR